MSNNSSNTCIIKNKSIASLNEVYKLIIRGEIKFEKGQYTKNIFSNYKKKLEEGEHDNIVVASIPFVRNLIEYTEDDTNPDYILLTSVLHYKDDGQGNTVYFSESIIIFTSNLGIYQNTPTGERVLVVTSDLSYEEVQTKVREGIERYFKLELGRPELLNRIGENIVVYDFIREGVAGEILDSQIKRICNNLKSDKNISLTISDKAHDTLLSSAIGNLDNGGRGIGNIVESLLINPLSRYMFDNELFSDCEITIDAINIENMTYSLECTYSTSK